MSDRVVIVTGGARGIGRAVARSLAADGWSVALCCRSSIEAARAVRDEIQTAGGQARAYVCDLADAQASVELAGAVEGEFGRVDALVHGAGRFRRMPVLEETAAGWQAMFDDNLHAVFHLTQAVLSGMRARQYGRIITFGLASADQLRAHTEITAHAVAKAALLMLTRSWAKAVAADGVTVNAVSPGVLDSGGVPPQEIERMRAHMPTGAVGRVEDAVGAVRYLLSEEAAYVNGANLQVSGGWGV